MSDPSSPQACNCHEVFHESVFPSPRSRPWTYWKCPLPIYSSTYQFALYVPGAVLNARNSTVRKTLSSGTVCQVLPWGIALVLGNLRQGTCKPTLTNRGRYLSYRDVKRMCLGEHTVSGGSNMMYKGPDVRGSMCVQGATSGSLWTKQKNEWVWVTTPERYEGAWRCMWLVYHVKLFGDLARWLFPAVQGI